MVDIHDDRMLDVYIACIDDHSLAGLCRRPDRRGIQRQPLRRELNLRSNLACNQLDLWDSRPVRTVGLRELQPPEARACCPGIAIPGIDEFPFLASRPSGLSRDSDLG